jgi:thioesterase domain-containing protein
VDAGQHVEWLGVLDAMAPPLKRAQLKMRWRLQSIHQRSPRERWAKYAEVVVRAVGSLLPRRQRDFDYRGVTEIGCRYRQPGHRVPMQLFVSEVSAASAGEDLLGWGDFHQGSVDGHRLAGDHASLLRLPDAEVLATSMLESLCAARESTRGQQAAAAEKLGSGGRHE